MSTLYQHIVIRGVEGKPLAEGYHYMTVVDEDDSTTRYFARYENALMYCIYILSQARMEEGQRAEAL